MIGRNLIVGVCLQLAACGGEPGISDALGFWEQSGTGLKPGLVVFRNGSRGDWIFNGEAVVSISYLDAVDDCSTYVGSGVDVKRNPESSSFRTVTRSGGGFMFGWDIVGELGGAWITREYLRRHPDLPANTSVLARFEMFGQLDNADFQISYQLVFSDAATGADLSTEGRCRRLVRAQACVPYSPVAGVRPLDPNC